MNRCLLWMCCALAACQPGPDEPQAPTGAEQAEASGDGAAPSPAEVAAMTARLKARHVADLPTAEQLAATPRAEASLREIARTGETMVVRTRALALLRHFHSPATGELLAGIVADAAAPKALRAAAVTGLGGQPLDAQPERLALVVAALRDDDPRIGVAAVEALGGSEGGRKALREAAQTGTLPPKVQAAIEAR